MRFLFIAILLLPVTAHGAELGSLTFPTSTKHAQAQAAFERGVAALHSFWYEEARASFQRARELDPSFAMAHWGETMTHNHPIWMEQDRDAAVAALGRLSSRETATAKEREWLATLDVLFGEGEKRARDAAYERALAAMAARYPDDVEVHLFHALSILGTLARDAEDARKQMRAAAILEPLLPALPDHPGLLHYMIHAYDDPLHAPLGLRAAKRYALVAPAAHHALHMPSHIFLQLGMWNEAAASNEQSWAASVAWVERDSLPSSKRDLHSLAWLQYIYLQQGRHEDAKRLLDHVAGEKGLSNRERSTRAAMRARWAVETGQDPGPAGGPFSLEDAAHCAAPAYGGDDAASFLETLIAIRRGDAAGTRSGLAALASSRESAPQSVGKRTIETMELVLRAMDLHKRGQLAPALDAARKAAEIEDTLGAPSGPPDVMKPGRELYGELLLAVGKPEEALTQFRLSLQRTPNRARSLAGEAAALKALGTTSAAR
jgi:tetratricopeptide (TPR) repeat protein